MRQPQPDQRERVLVDRWGPPAVAAAKAVVMYTAIAEGRSVAVGAAALVAILVAHYLVEVGRFHPRFARVVDHRVRVLVDHGHLRPDQLRRCGLTEDEVLAQLRQHDIASVTELRYVLYEAKGELTLVRGRGALTRDPELVAVGLRDAAGYPPTKQSR